MNTSPTLLHQLLWHQHDYATRYAILGGYIVQDNGDNTFNIAPTRYTGRQRGPGAGLIRSPRSAC